MMARFPLLAVLGLVACWGTDSHEEDTGCPSFTFPVSTASLGFDWLILDGVTLDAGFDPSVHDGDQPAVCVGEDGEKVHMLFTVDGSVFGEVVMAAERGEVEIDPNVGGTGAAGPLGSFMSLQMFGHDPPVTFNDGTWDESASWYQHSVGEVFHAEVEGTATSTGGIDLDISFELSADQPPGE